MEGTARLKAAGIESPHREARMLLAHALDVDQAAIIGHPERAVPDPGVYLDLVDRRGRGVPAAHLLGWREFWSLPFRVTPDTLIPRPETETLVDAALKARAGQELTAPALLDLGTGSGCLLLSLLSEIPGAKGIGVDRSAAAVEVARGNAARLRLADRARFLVSDWAAALTGRFDIVVSNPPYIACGEIADLQLEVARHEPKLALDGGEDGLTCYREIVGDLSRLLNPGATVFLEVGAGQWEPVAALLKSAGLSVSEPVRDLAGISRCVAARLA